MAIKPKLVVDTINLIDMNEIFQLILTYAALVSSLHSKIDRSEEITVEEAAFLREDMVNRYYKPQELIQQKVEIAEVENYYLQSLLDNFKLSKI